MKTIKLFLFAALGLFSLNSCMKEDFENHNDYTNIAQAFFTMINAYGSSEFVIHKADNNYIQTMNNPLKFKEINLVALYPGNRRLQTLDKDNKILIDSTYAIKDKTLYTSIIFNKSGNKAGQHLIVDTLLNNLANNAAIRFVNLAEGTENVDLFVGNNEVISNRSFDGTKYLPQNYKFIPQQLSMAKVTAKDAANNTLAEREISFSAGIHYTFILIKNINSQYEIIAHQQYKN